jgi:hypothetical protein
MLLAPKTYIDPTLNGHLLVEFASLAVFALMPYSTRCLSDFRTTTQALDDYRPGRLAGIASKITRRDDCLDR